MFLEPVGESELVERSSQGAESVFYLKLKNTPKMLSEYITTSKRRALMA